MTTPVDICSNALTLLGGQTIASLDEGSAGAEISKQLFEGTYHSMLSEYRWHFATRSLSLSKLSDPTGNHFTNKFLIPSDCLYVTQCTSNPYEIYEDEIYANAEEITIEYIFAPKLNRLPAYFIKALQYKLATEFAIPLTTSTQKAQVYDALYEKQVKKARFIDATSRTPDNINSKPYIRARY